MVPGAEEIPQNDHYRGIGYLVIGTVGGGLLILAALWSRFGPTLSPKSLRCAQVATALLLFAFIAVAAYMGFRDFDAVGKHHDSKYRGFGEATAFIFAILLIPTSKHVGLGRILGSSYERMMWIHPLLGCTVAITMTVHFGGMVQNSPNSFAHLMSDRTYFYGFLAWIFTMLMVLPAVFVRKLSYRVFRITHMLFIVVLILATLHYSRVWRMILPGVLLFVADVIIRLVVTVRASATIVSATPVGGANVVDLKVHVGWKTQPHPGAYVFLRIPSIGVIQHPFTVAQFVADSDGSNNDGGGVARFLIGTHGEGSWTKALTDRSDQLQKDGTSVHVTGPYGRLQIPLTQCKHVVLVAGGIGITPMLHILDVIAQKKLSSETQSHRIERISLVWMVRSMDLLQYVTSAFVSTLAPSSVLDIHIFCTQQEQQLHHPPNQRFGALPFEHGRPDLNKLLGELSSGATPGNKSVGCYICGPPVLMDAARDAATSHGMMVHEEVFEIF